VLTSKISLPTTCVAHALGYAILAGGELEQIQFLLGHASVQTTEHYLGCKQRLSQAVNDKLGLEDT
jgi:site-specific recombinase XerD